MRFPYYKQLNAMDCGPTCLRMVAKYYGKHFNADKLRQMAGFSKQGVSLLGISDTAEKIGFRTRGVNITVEQLKQAALPAILHWDQNHFVVLFMLTTKQAKIADSGKGIINYSISEVKKHWISSQNKEDQDVGTALLLEPTSLFYENEEQKENKLGWHVVMQYLNNSRWQIVQVFAALIIGSILSLIFPFLTQSIVDTGINTQSLQFIIIVCTTDAYF